MNRLIIILLAGAISSCGPAYALRCGNTLPSIGDDYYTVTHECVVDHEYKIQRDRTDTVYVYIKEGNFMHELVFTDGHLYTIDGL